MLIEFREVFTPEMVVLYISISNFSMVILITTKKIR